MAEANPGSRGSGKPESVRACNPMRAPIPKSALMVAKSAFPLIVNRMIVIIEANNAIVTVTGTSVILLINFIYIPPISSIIPSLNKKKRNSFEVSLSSYGKDRSRI